MKKKGGKRVSDCLYGRGRRLAGVLLVLLGVLLVFVCLPAELLFICLGAVLCALGLLLLRR